MNKDIASQDKWDIAIIGAGIVGLLCAYFANQRSPHSKILLIDKGQAGHGATRYAGAIMGLFGETSFKRELSRFSCDFYVDYQKKNPSFPLYQIPIDWSFLPNNSENFFRFIGLNTFPCNTSQRSGRHASERIYVIDSLEAHASIKRDLLRNKMVSLREECEIVACEKKGEQFLIHTSSFTNLEASRLIIATGPWSIPPWTPIFPQLLLRTKKIVSLCVKFPIKEHQRGLAVYERDIFMIPIHHRNYWLYSFTSPEWLSQGVDEQKFVLTETDINTATQLVEDIFPHFLSHGYTARIHSDSYSKDNHPIIWADQTRKLGIGIGCCGSGIRLAPGIANQLLNTLGV